MSLIDIEFDSLTLIEFEFDRIEFHKVEFDRVGKIIDTIAKLHRSIN